MIFQTDTGLKVGGIVLYKQDEIKKYVPAVIVTIYPQGADDKHPDLGVVVFVTDLHNATYSRSRVKFGEKVGEYLLTSDEAHESLERKNREAKETYEKQLAAVKAAEPIKVVAPSAPPEEAKQAEPAEPKQEHKKPAK